MKAGKREEWKESPVLLYESGQVEWSGVDAKGFLEPHQLSDR